MCVGHSEGSMQKGLESGRGLYKGAAIDRSGHMSPCDNKLSRIVGGSKCPASSWEGHKSPEMLNHPQDDP